VVDDGEVYAYDIDNNHAPVKQFPIPETGKRGVAVAPNQGLLYISECGMSNSSTRFGLGHRTGSPPPTQTPTATPSVTPSPSPSPSPTVTVTPSPGSTLAQDTFQRPNQALWGTASDGHTWGGDANTVSAFSILNNTGQISNGNGIYNAVLGSTATDAEVLFSGSMSSYSNTNLGSVLRWSNTNNWYKAYINGTTLVVQKKVNGATTIIGSTSWQPRSSRKRRIVKAIGSSLPDSFQLPAKANRQTSPIPSNTQTSGITPIAAQATCLTVHSPSLVKLADGNYELVDEINNCGGKDAGPFKITTQINTQATKLSMNLMGPATQMHIQETEQGAL